MSLVLQQIHNGITEHLSLQAKEWFASKYDNIFFLANTNHVYVNDMCEKVIVNFDTKSGKVKNVS